jgi:hypothetical protein
MPEEIEALISLKFIQQFTNEPPKLIVSAFRRLAQERLQLGEDLLDRIRVRTVGRQGIGSSPRALQQWPGLLPPYGRTGCHR